MAILGAGAVGVEFASCFHRFGSKVSLFEMLPRIVPVEDEDVSKELPRLLRRLAFASKPAPRSTGQRPENRFRRPLQRDACERHGRSRRSRCLLVAVGRRPKTDNIGLEGTRVELDRGFVKVDEMQRTGEPGVYAIGDIVAGTPQLAHVSTAEGMIAIAHIAGKPPPPLTAIASPAPPIASPASAASA